MGGGGGLRQNYKVTNFFNRKKNEASEKKNYKTLSGFDTDGVSN
jgi:hypothetical protein